MVSWCNVLNLNLISKQKTESINTLSFNHLFHSHIGCFSVGWRRAIYPEHRCPSHRRNASNFKEYISMIQDVKLWTVEHYIRLYAFQWETSQPRKETSHPRKEWVKKWGYILAVKCVWLRNQATFYGSCPTFLERKCGVQRCCKEMCMDTIRSARLTRAIILRGM